jgi:DNA polymerase-3 subunit epsilon
MSVPPPNVGYVTGPLRYSHSPARPCPALADLTFTVVDLETTGWSPQEAGVTEVGAVRFRAGQVLGEVTMLVNPGTPVPAEITELTGLTDDMLAAAPAMAAVLPAVLAFSQGSVIVAHNAPFDIGFLTAACQAAHLTWPVVPVLDTLPLARALVDSDEVPDCKLTTLTRHFEVPHEPHHRALADARATAALLGIFLDRAAARGFRTLCQLLSWLDSVQAAAAVG